MDVSPLISSGDEAGEASYIEDVFTDDNIDVIARPVTPTGSAEFISDPDETYNQAGWLVWHRNSNSGNSLIRVRGNQAYLVHNGGSSAISVVISGEVGFFAPDWFAGSYNLLGFSLTGSPTFGEFFGSTGESDGVHPISKILRLQASTGAWVSVQSSDSMAPGEAYWVFSERNSTFAGPVAVDFDGSSYLPFGSGPASIKVENSNGNQVSVSTRELTLTNVDDEDHAVNLSKTSPSTSGTGADSDELRVYEIVPDPSTLEYQLASGFPISSQNLGTVSSQTTTYVTLGANRNWTSGASERENLYRLEIALGSSGATQYFWLPMTASRSDLSSGESGAADPSYAGLWVGQADLSSVTSIAETGNPVVGTTSVLPITIIVHVDASGSASLLSHVLFMQTKTANEDIAPEPVLVVNEEKIPFFQGVEERDGNLVGRRIETTAYDMPLLYDASIQGTPLLTIVAEALDLNDGEGNPDPTMVTSDDLMSYTLAQDTKPAHFVDSYAISWPLTGGLGPGLLAETTSPLKLDPFHRSNPFRHAFHPSHGAGIQIIRSISISFDDNNTDGQLTGTYTEAIDQLTNLAVPLVASGPLTLRRVSTISDLQ